MSTTALTDTCPACGGPLDSPTRGCARCAEAAGPYAAPRSQQLTPSAPDAQSEPGGAPKRPLSLTIIAGFLLLGGVSSVVSSFFVLGDPQALAITAQLSESALIPIPVELRTGIGIVQALLTLACAIALLRGRIWGRTLYVASVAFGYLLAPLTPMLLPGLVLMGVVLFFLYRPAASAYLRGEAPRGDSLG